MCGYRNNTYTLTKSRMHPAESTPTAANEFLSGITQQSCSFFFNNERNSTGIHKVKLPKSLHRLFETMTNPDRETANDSSKLA